MRLQGLLLDRELQLERSLGLGFQLGLMVELARRGRPTPLKTHTIKSGKTQRYKAQSLVHGPLMRLAQAGRGWLLSDYCR